MIMRDLYHWTIISFTFHNLTYCDLYCTFKQMCNIVNTGYCDELVLRFAILTHVNVVYFCKFDQLYVLVICTCT